MAEIKGIDVSAWNGSIDWATVANYGMGFAILRITEKNNRVDNTFEANYQGCTSNNIPVGVYKYSYATSIAEIKEEANIVVNTLKKRKLTYPVFLDIEDKCQENIPETTMMEMINAFRSIIINAGYKFGIYCGNYWYKTKLPKDAKKYDCWLAAYPSNDDGTLQERLRPSEGIGWQYSSKATIPGIPSKVDRNVFYKDYSKESPDSSQNSKPSVTPTTPSKTAKDAINAVLNIAKAEIGYLEKASNSQLDSKTANAGRNNYTKYWRDVYPQYQAQAWCACFVTWCFDRAFGKENTKKLLKHYPYVYCPTLGNLFTKHANPEVGDIVIFYRNGTFAHTGLVTKVNGDYFETVEGNASGASGITPNGGGVVAKSYYNSNLPGTKFCRPDWNYAAKCLGQGSTSEKPKAFKRTNSGTVKINPGSSLNVRSTPDGSIVGQVYNGNRFDVDENQTSGKWLYVKFTTVGVGYVSKDYVVLDKKQETPKPTNPPTPVETIQVVNYTVKPNDTLDSIAKAHGMTVKDLITVNNWLTPGAIVKVTKTIIKGEWVGEVTSNKLNVRVKPDLKADKVKEYPQLGKGNKVRVIGKGKGSDMLWYKVAINNATTQNKDIIGYVVAKYIKKA